MLNSLTSFLLTTVVVNFAISAVPSSNESLSAVYRSRRKAAGATYRSFTSLAPNGRKMTTLWYFNPNGPNYKFTIYGSQPKPDGEMVDWLERYHHKYTVTPIEYEGGERTTLPFGTAPQTSRQTVKPLIPVVKETTPPAESSVDGLFPSDCGQRPLRVEGGREAQIEAYPWQVALIYNTHKGLKCGGSIITNRHVVTAAHCFEYYPNRNIINQKNRLVVAGVTDLSDREREYEILHLFIHGSYNKVTIENDIALIMIDGIFNFGMKIYPICLPLQDEGIRAGRECTVSGWGRVSIMKRYTEIRLRAAEVNVTTDRQCKEKNTGVRNIGIGMFCAGNFEKGGVDTCTGDSGGPLICEEGDKFTLFGVTSWGIGCGQPGYPGVYTKVPKYVNWIKNAVKVSLTL